MARRGGRGLGPAPAEDDDQSESDHPAHPVILGRQWLADMAAGPWRKRSFELSGNEAGGLRTY
jgi:hypothetical protein